MPISLNSMQQLVDADLSSEQMRVVMRVLAVELAPLEERRERDKARKFHGRHKGISTDSPQNVRGQSAECPASRVEDNNNLSSSKEDLELSPSLSKPLPANPKATAQEPSDFAAFMAVYPRRSGSVDRKSALKAWEPAKKRASVETIMEGARRYNSEMTAKGKVGTEYVKQARTWLNADGWTEYQPVSVHLSAVPSMAKVIEGSPAFEAWCRHNGKRPMVTEARVDGQICRVAYFPTEYPPSRDSEAA